MRRLLLSSLAFVLIASPAFADATGFLARTPTPVGRPGRGFAVGTGLIIVGLEFEYCSIDEKLDVPAGADFTSPAIKTYMFNGLLQTPIPIARMQFYGTIGGGLYRETLSTDPTNSETNFGTNVGGGAKISIAGPLRLRVDYRVFTLRGSPRHTPVQRLYAGINLKF